MRKGSSRRGICETARLATGDGFSDQRCLRRVNGIEVIGRLDGHEVVHPKAASAPPASVLPDIGVVGDVAEHLIQGLEAGRIRAGAKLTEEKPVAVLPSPQGHLVQPVSADRRSDDAAVRPRAVRVEILVGLKYVVVQRVFDPSHRASVRADRPQPSAIEAGAGHDDGLLRPGLADRRDGCVGGVAPLVLALLAGFAHQHEHDLVVESLVAISKTPP